MRLHLRRLCIALTICAAAALAITFRPSHDLTDIATRLAVASEHLSTESYAWLNDNEIVAFSAVSGKGDLVDINTGATRPAVHDVNDQEMQAGSADGSMAEQRGYPGFPKTVFRCLDPSREWICDSYQRLPTLDLSATRLSDGKTFKWKVDENTREVAWLPGKLRAAAILQESGTVTGVDVYSPESQTPKRYNLHIVAPTLRNIAAMPDGTIFVTEDEPNETDKGHLLWFGAEPVKPKLRREVQLPYTAIILQVIPSPRGDKLAWYLDRKETLPEEPWLRRLYQMFGRRDRRIGEIWISRLDGTGLRSLGYADSEREGGPYSLQWTPSGKYLSFLADRTLYRMHVE